MTFFGSFKTVDTMRVKLSEFMEIVDPVGTQSRSISDKLAPHSSSEPVLDGSILACHSSNCSAPGAGVKWSIYGISKGESAASIHSWLSLQTG